LIRHPSGTLEAGKLRARVNAVKSGIAARRRESIDRFAAAIAPLLRTSPRQNHQRDFLFAFSRGMRASFSSQENFLAAMKIKFQIKFIFFLSILKAISTLKPAGEGETRTHVNKL
jgi:hypothetical protein